MKIAFFEDGSLEGAQAHVAPAYQGVRLALSLASADPSSPATLELDLFDDGGQAPNAISQAQQVAADPGYVAAVAAPFWIEPATVAQALSGAGIPTLSLSTLGASGGPGWFRLVATLSQEAIVIAAYVRGISSNICLLGDGSAYSTQLGADVADGLGPIVRWRADITDPASIPRTVEEIRSKGCGALVWTGMGTEAALLKISLRQSNLGSLPFVTGDGAKDPAFLSEAAGAGKGTIAFCPCADLSTSKDMTAQRFIHNFQTSYGVPPGVFGVEGYDAGRMIAAAAGSEASTRQGVTTALREGFPFHGLAGTYAMTNRGELAPASVKLRQYVDLGIRWLPDGGTTYRG